VSEQALLLDFAVSFLRRVSADVTPPEWATQGWATRPITPEFIQELENRVLLLSITTESGYHLQLFYYIKFFSLSLFLFCIYLFIYLVICNLFLNRYICW
jgi:hypothetical protein